MAPRIPYLTRNDLPEADREIFDQFIKDRGTEPGHIHRVVANAPNLLRRFLGLANELRNGTRSIREVVQLDEEDLGVEEIAIKTRVTLRTIDKIEKLHAEALQQATRLNGPQKTRGSARPRARRQLSRTQVEMSQLVRSIRFHPLEQKRLIEVLR